MAMRLLSFAIWAVVAASAVFWLMRLLARPDAAPPHTVIVAANTAVAAADLSRLLGSTRTAAADTSTPEPPVDSRFKLVGVVASKAASPSGGLALIAVDGKPPRPVGLGGSVDGSLVLLGVNHRRADLGPAGGSPTVRLELPAVPEPNRSVRLPSLGAPTPTAPPPLPARPQPIPPPPTAQNPQPNVAPPPGSPAPQPVPPGGRGTPNLTR
jgi:general secretion pathway protein C